jgi:deoxyribodipyrimidine photo-lyase
LQAVYCNNDYEPEAVRRDQNVEQLLNKRGASLYSFKDHVIFEKNEIISMSGKPYTVYTPYMKRWKEQLNQDALVPFASDTLLHRCLDHGFSFPHIDETGYSHISTEFPSAQPDEAIIRNYHLTRDYPALNGTSKIGIHLRFGTVSVRQMVSLAQRLNETWLNELIWREFFMQLMFHNPYVAEGAYRKQFAFIEWRNDETEFERWCRGETGFPMVDAGMRELVFTGICTTESG